MVQLLYTIMLTMSLTFIFTNHPLSMGLTMLIQATLVSMITGLLSHNFWFSYILFMIMIGGLLVLFIYMTSVASNEKFFFSPKLMVTIITMMVFTLLILTIDYFPFYQTTLNIDIYPLDKHTMFKLMLSKYLNYPTYWIMISMIIYLFITLIAAVKITNITYGPLRQKF